jgi:hypothetical protein
MIEFPPVPGGEPVVVSATAYVAFRQCAEMANARFRGEYGPPSQRAFVGGLAHRVIARHLTTGPIDASAFEQVCREEIGSNPSLNYRLGELGLAPSTLAPLISEVQELYERVQTMPTAGLRGAEVVVAAEPAPGVVLQGQVDAVFDDEDGVRLVDWKTGKIEDHDDQLLFYALAWSLERVELPVRVEAISVRTGEHRRLEPTVAQLSETATAVAVMVGELRRSWSETRGLPRSGGPWCRFCPLLDGCSEGQAASLLLAKG